jgi:hypothetical protein
MAAEAKARRQPLTTATAALLPFYYAEQYHQKYSDRSLLGGAVANARDCIHLGVWAWFVCCLFIASANIRQYGLRSVLCRSLHHR